MKERGGVFLRGRFGGRWKEASGIELKNKSRYLYIKQRKTKEN